MGIHTTILKHSILNFANKLLDSNKFHSTSCCCSKVSFFIMLTFNENNLVLQRFPFKASIMEYIFKNLRPEHLLKLYKTCKFFYAKYGLNIIRHLEIVDEDVPECFDPNKTTICYSNPALEKLKDFWITDSFFFQAPSDSYYLLPSFSNSTIKKLEARDNLLWDEYEALTRAGTIEELRIGKVLGKEDFAPIEDIIAQVPNATFIEFSECKLTSTTFSTLASLNHQVKISHFVLENMVSAQINVDDPLEDFLIKHFDPYCNVHLGLKLVPEGSVEEEEAAQQNALIKTIEKTCNKIVANVLQTMKNDIITARLEKENAERKLSCNSDMA